MAETMQIATLEAAVDATLAAVGNRIVLGIPLGIGKPNPFVNALYRRVQENPAFHLKIFTALSLEKPKGHSELEARFIDPFAARVFGDYPDLQYVIDLRENRLPPNIEVYEFFMKTGEYLNNPLAQQHYIYSNYTHAARDMVLNGVNVIAQAVACEEHAGRRRLSLSSNPDITLDALDLVRGEAGRKMLMVGVINRKLPFMPNTAEVPESMFDLLVTDPAGTHDLFAPPNMKVSLADYGIGLWASSLVRDGGTLQIGIGSLGDAIAQALITRDRRNDDYRQILGELSPAGIPAQCELGRFAEGLYGCSEMFVNGFLELIKAGVVRRLVYPDADIQRLVNANRIGSRVTPQTLVALREEGLIGDALSENDVAFLQQFGIFKREVKWDGGELVVGEHRISCRLDDDAACQAIGAHCLGGELAGGVFMHGGFFIGPREFYQTLRDMPRQELDRIDMCRIGFINELFGHEALARAQRKNARFMNATMMVTLLGAAVSDSLDSGRLVSGVGGQYNFVAMGHALPDARSVLMLRATRVADDRVHSNIVWNYAHTTIPRHLRDLVVTEYGVADLRGQSDAEVAKRLLAITDSRFQDSLLAEAKRNGKIEADYEIPLVQKQNLPEALEAKLRPWRQAGALPDFPFGTDFTEDELTIVRALRKLKHATEHPAELLQTVVASLLEDKEVPERYLERMQLKDVDSLKLKLLRRLFVGNL